MRKVFSVLVILLLSNRMISAVPADTAHFYMKHSYDVLNYDLDFNLFGCYLAPYPHSFSASEVVTLKADSAIAVIKLNALNNSLEIDSVRQAGISFIHISDTLYITLDRTYSTGEVLSVKIFYRHKDVADQGIYTGNGFVFTDFPPEGARKVFPCWDRPSDKATTEIRARISSVARLGSTGILSDSTVSGDTISYHWVNDQPVATYLITLTSKSACLIDRSYWHNPENPDDSVPSLLYYRSGENIVNARQNVLDITDFYSEKFGRYPFGKIGFCTLNALFAWGGMENQTMVNLMPGGFLDVSLIAHEHSHQWFGDLITCGTWADIWLNEGFGTYCAQLWTEHTSGYGTYKNKMNQLANYYLTYNPGWALYNPIWAIHTPSGNELYNTATTYDKGACVLFQLRYVLGDSMFFSVMKSYATDTLFTFKNAITEQFAAKVNEVTGQDYSWFFNEWVFAPNHPEYENIYTIKDLGNNTWKAILDVDQVQTGTVFFKMPIEVSIVFYDGSDTLVKVMNDTNPQTFEWTFNKAPVSVVFDPGRNILLKEANTIVGIFNPYGSNTFNLDQNEPNPFSGQTRISYSVGKPCITKISVTDSNGRSVETPVNRFHEPGSYSFQFNAGNLSAGQYILQMKASDFSQSRKMILVK